MTSRLKIIGKGEGGAPSCATPQITFLNSADGSVEATQFMGRAAVITLGCAKNQVDSEIMLGALKAAGYEIVNDVAHADIAVVNTCGFLESSVQESIDCILEVAEYKDSGQLRKLIVAGCMVERYQGDIAQTLPEVDHFISVNDILRVTDAASGNMGNFLADGARPYFLYDERLPRELSTLPHTAYVKVSEGCNRPCTFCIIPKIRGPLRSRTISSVRAEIRDLGSRGVREVVLVAQDLTAYGADHKDGGLADLLEGLDSDAAVDWIRLLYAYPLGVDERLMRRIADLPRVCEYLDMPLQHASEAVLKRMQRPLGKYSPRRIVESMRGWAPEVALRTTFIVGFPGETDEDVRDLENFVRDGHFTHVGVFTYSREQGTPSYDLDGHISQEEKDERRERVMLAQAESYAKRASGLVGKRVPVLIEGLHEESDLLMSGRTRFQAPDVDGSVIINDSSGDVDPSTLIGQIVEVSITEALGYDLVGRLEVTAE